MVNSYGGDFDTIMPLVLQASPDCGGTQNLQSRQIPMTEILLSGGLTKTPETGQIVANVFGIPVRLLEGAEEGCSWGAAVLAKYRHDCSIQGQENPSPTEWPTFLQSIAARPSRIYQPVPEEVEIYKRVYERYQNLLALEKQLLRAISTDVQ